MHTPTTLETLLKQRKQHLTTLQTQNNILSTSISSLTTKQNTLSTSLNTGQSALTFLESIANSRRTTLKSQIESIVSEALQLVYGPSLKTTLSYDIKNGRSFVDINIIKSTPYGDISRTMEGIGGGVSDTISVPLRLLVLLSSRTTDKICILDEAYKHVDLDRINNAASFIADISHKLHIQIIMSSHHEAMQDNADTVYSVTESLGTSTIKKLK